MLTQLAGENVWTAQCIFVCNAARPNVFEMDGVAYLKLQHSRPAQKVTFTGDSEHDFIHTVERSFAALLKDRSWMPLAAYRVGAYAQARVTLDRLTAKDREAGTWTRQFLDEHCVVLDSKGRAHIYLALQNALLTLAEVRDLATADAASAGKHQTQQQAPPRSTNGTSGPSSPAAIGSPYATNNSFSPPQSTLTSSRTSIEGNVPPVPTLVKRPAPPANHAVIRQPLNATYKPNALSALSTAVNSPQVSHEMEVDAKQLSPAADTAVIGRIDYAADGHVHKTQNADLSATALSKAISSPSASVSSSPTLTSSSTASVLSSGPSRKEVSLRQRLFKGSKPKTPMATPKSSYEALSFVEQSPRLVQKPRPQLDMQTKPKQASMNDDIRSSKSSSLDLSLFQERPQLVQKPKPAVDTQTTRKQPSATEYPHSPLRIQGRPKSPHPSTKATPSLHARRPSTQSKRTTRSAASKFSKTSKPRPRSQSRSRASSTSRQNDAADGPHDWAYQLKEATASKESLRLKKAQEEERKLYMQKLGMRNVKVVKGGFWRRAFGGK